MVSSPAAASASLRPDHRSLTARPRPTLFVASAAPSSFLPGWAPFRICNSGSESFLPSHRNHALLPVVNAGCGSVQGAANDHTVPKCVRQCFAARYSSGLRWPLCLSLFLLFYTGDQCLLDTRRRLLQEAGYPVWTASQIPDVFAIITEERSDVLILCHTLSQGEFTWAIAFADVQSPPVKCIVLNRKKSGYRGELPQNVLDARDQPADLLAAVEGLVSRTSRAHSHFIDQSHCKRI
jgi:hypothetical protein